MKKIAMMLLSATLMTVVLGCNKPGENAADTIDSGTTVGETTTAEDTTAEPVILPEFVISEEELFVDLSEEKRSSHLGHALVEYEPNKILAFYSNTDGDIRSGHNCIGWVEYKRSEDGGKTWSEPVVLQYSKDQADNKEAYIACEKAVVTEDGKIVLFCYRSIYQTQYYGPNIVPTYLISEDGGVTWSDAKELGTREARVFDAIVKDGDIYVLARWDENSPSYQTGDPTYVMYKSVDNGESFDDGVGVTRMNGLYYGTMVATPEGNILIYMYQSGSERNLLVYETTDGTKYTPMGTSYCVKKIRNPQVIYLNGWYFLHGRSGNDGPYFVLYTSTDGMNWDRGTYITKVSAGFPGSCYYSNNLVVNGERILIQASDNYEAARTNVKSWWIDFKDVQ